MWPMESHFQKMIWLDYLYLSRRELIGVLALGGLFIVIGFFSRALRNLKLNHKKKTLKAKLSQVVIRLLFIVSFICLTDKIGS